jgi:hypothetical protein
VQTVVRARSGVVIGKYFVNETDDASSYLTVIFKLVDLFSPRNVLIKSWCISIPPVA